MPKKARTMAAIDPKRLRKHFSALVDIYSPSGKEEEVVSYASGVLKRAGIPFERQEVDEDRDNLLILPESGEAEVVLAGHLDTVSAQDYENYACEFEGDIAWGLGTADMKSGCAAMLEAFIAYHEAYDRVPKAALALLVGEEENGDGAQALVREYHFDYAIVGEPTDLAVCMSHYGYVELGLRASGKRMHASQAEHAPSAIKAMLAALGHLTPMLDAHVPSLIYNIRDMASSQSGFAVPESCSAWLDLHLPPGLAPDAFIGHVEEALDAARSSVAPASLTARFTTLHAGYTLPHKGPFAEGLAELAQKEGLHFAPSPFPSHSDAAILWEAGIKPVICGPGRLEVSHTRDECVSFAQTEQAARFYLRLLERLDAM